MLIANPIYDTVFKYLMEDIMRFRRYIGEQYKKEDEVMQEDGSAAKEPLPIVTIFFLGFYISRTLPGVIKVDRMYIDVLAGEPITERNDFIERLSHDSYVIRIPGLRRILSKKAIIG
jgi:hypothetical protein